MTSLKYEDLQGFVAKHYECREGDRMTDDDWDCPKCKISLAELLSEGEVHGWADRSHV